MHMRIALACVLFGSLALTQSREDPAITYARRIIAGQKTYQPSAGYVPDSTTAVRIATAVLDPIYGKAKIAAEKPWHVGLIDGVWTVVGTFNGRGNGGEAIVQIDKRTGAIKFVGHTM